jgi:hypothetical protein
VRVDSSDSLTFSKYVSGGLLTQDTVIKSTPVVFPKRTMPGW